MLARRALPRTLVLLVALLGAPAAHAGGGQAPAGDIAAVVEGAVNLPVSINRIRKLLDRLPALEEGEGLLRLNVQVRVFAPAPPIDVFRGFDLEHSPPRYGAPVHADMVAVATPSRFRNASGGPGFNTGHLISWGGR